MSFEMHNMIIKYDPTLYPLVSEDELEFLNDNFRLVGSRAIIDEDKLKHDTDFDFIGCYSAIVEHDMIVRGYEVTQKVSKPGSMNYLDCSTEVVLVKPNIQICLKRPEMWEECNKFWGLMEKNPELYRCHFWKSNPTSPTTQDIVRERVNLFMEQVIPFVKI